MKDFQNYLLHQNLSKNTIDSYVCIKDMHVDFSKFRTGVQKFEQLTF